MKSSIAVTDPNSIAMTLSVTMTVGEWKQVRKSLDEDVIFSVPTSNFKRAIRELVEKACGNFDVDLEEGEA